MAGSHHLTEQQLEAPLEVWWLNLQRAAEVRRSSNAHYDLRTKNCVNTGWLCDDETFGVVIKRQ